MSTHARLGAFLVALWLSAQAATPAQPAPHPQTPPPCCIAPAPAQPIVPDARGTDQSPVAVKVTQLPPAEPPRDWSGWVIAGATVVLGLVTAALAVFTFKLWRATGALVKENAQTAERQLRAYVFVRQAFIRNTAAEPARAYIVFENSGKTPAYRVAISTWVGTAETFAALPELPESKGCGHLAPGAPLTVGVSVYPPLTEPQMAALLAGETTLFAHGEVRYADAFKRPHFTNFCVKASGDGALDNGAPLASCREGNETDDAI